MKTAHHFPTQIPPMDPYTPTKSQRLCLGDEVCSWRDPASSPPPLLWDIFSYYCFPYCSCPSHSHLLTISPKCRLRASACLYLPSSDIQMTLPSPAITLSDPASLPFTLHYTLFLTLFIATFHHVRLCKDVSVCGYCICISVCPPWTVLPQHPSSPASYPFTKNCLLSRHVQGKDMNCSLLHPFAWNSAN